jgi:hypothetical protein
MGMGLSSYLLEDHVYGTPCVYIHKVNRGVIIDELSTLGHGINVGPAHLHAKQILRLVALQQCPLTLLALEGIT